MYPDSSLNAVDLPIPLWPTRPRICPGLGIGRVKS